MKQYRVIPGQDKIEAVEFLSEPIGATEMRVKVFSTSINYRDIITRKVTKKAVVPFSDGAGEVVEVGEAVEAFAVGDRVMGLFFPTWQEGDITAADFSQSRGAGKTDGMLSEYVAGPATGFVHIPDYMSYQQAATLPCAGVTAWHALMEAPLAAKAGDTVLIQGTGGVSIFAIQIAKALGIHTVVISSSDEKLETAKALGATHTINYVSTPEWQEDVLSLTDGIGVDRVLEVGGAGTLEKSMHAVKMGGVISLIGILTGIKGEINPFPILTKSLRVQGIYVASRAMQQRFHTFLDEHQLQPVIDKVFDFEDANEAYAYQKAAKHIGKIVVDVHKA